MRSTPLLLALTIAGCAAPQSNVPSLAPRAGESIDPRLPVEGGVPPAPASSALVARLAALVAEARAGDAAFTEPMAAAERLAAAAGPAQSESWVDAQQALSAAVAARAPTTRALADLDALASEVIAGRSSSAAADLAAIENASTEVRQVADVQAARIAATEARLSG